MLRMISFALAPLVLMLTAAFSPAAPPGLYSPGYVSPANTYHYPSGRDFVSPANRTTSHYFVPPQSYYLHPYNPEPNIAPQYPPGPASRSPKSDEGTYPLESASRSPKADEGPDVPLVPRALREPEVQPKAPAVIGVRVPAGAEVWFNGEKTQRTGIVRVFQSPPLEPGTRYAYDVKARWIEDGKEMERTFHVPVTAGARSEVTFRK